MKKALLFVIPLLFLAACDRQKTYVVGEDAFCTGLADTDIDPVLCVDAKDSPINGFVIEYDQNGNLAREITVRNGRENGIEKEYHKNGNLHIVTNVVDGRAVGVSQVFNEDGSLYMEMTWVEGVATDIKIYDESGKVVANIDKI